MAIDTFQLYTGNNIPFIEGQLIVHQPTLKEIGIIGERTFHIGCELLRFSKENLDAEDRTRLENISDFEILMSIMLTKRDIAFLEQSNSALQVLALLFPDYRINFEEKRITFIRQLENGEDEIGFLNKDNFPMFKKILGEMFCLAPSVEEEFNPAGDMARKIAEKFKNRKRDLDRLKSGSKEKVSTVYGRYVSILSAAEHKSVHDLLNCTIYQLLDEYERYMLKYNSDIHIQAQMAGAKDLDKAEDWTKDLHAEK